MHVAITGASSGIGEAMAREFAGAGATITLVARRRELLERIAADLGVKTHVVVHDLADPDHAADWIPLAEDVLGPIDVLINNAGAQNPGPAFVSDTKVGRRVLDVNLTSPLVITRAILPGMVARGSGTIVQVASVVALNPTPMHSWYSASKAGLAAFGDALRAELVGTGVHVLTVYPGPVDTAMSRESFEVAGKSGLLALIPQGVPDVLARLVRTAVERKRKRVIYPGFYATTRWIPWFSRWITDVASPASVRTINHAPQSRK